MLHRLLTWIYNSFLRWSDASGPDTYIPIGAVARPLETDPVIPEDLRTSDVPYLGKDQDALLRKAMLVSNDRVVRIKWLRSIQHLRANSKTGWVLDGGSKPKWGNGETPEAKDLNRLVLS